MGRIAAKLACPRCGARVVVEREDKEAAYHARCEGCGHRYPYVQLHKREGRTEVVASDGQAVYSVGLLPKRKPGKGSPRGEAEERLRVHEERLYRQIMERKRRVAQTLDDWMEE